MILLNEHHNYYWSNVNHSFEVNILIHKESLHTYYKSYITKVIQHE